MRNKETGEFELVVGDKQLLSGFFIGVLLLAVVFAMGYVLGQNSPKSAKVAADTTALAPPTQDGRPQPAPPAAPPNPDAPPAGNAVDTSNPSADAAQAAANPPAEAPPQPTTQPARDVTAPPPAAAPQAADTANASYWQVTARATRASAEAVYQSLKDQGFPALIRPGPNNLTVVWVGPYNDKASLAAARTKLEKAGFAEIIRKPDR